MTKGSLLVTDNTDCDDIDDDDDLAVDWEVESYAAAAANSTSQPHETIVQNPSAESQLSCGVGSISYRPAYHPMLGSETEGVLQLASCG